MAGTFLLHISKDLLDVAAASSSARDAGVVTEQEALAQGLAGFYNAMGQSRGSSKRAAATLPS